MDTHPFAITPPSPALTYTEVAAELGITRRTLDKLIAAGKGPKVLRLSARCVRIRRNELDRWLAERENT